MYGLLGEGILLLFVLLFALLGRVLLLFTTLFVTGNGPAPKLPLLLFWVGVTPALFKLPLLFVENVLLLPKNEPLLLVLPLLLLVVVGVKVAVVSVTPKRELGAGFVPPFKGGRLLEVVQVLMMEEFSLTLWSDKVVVAVLLLGGEVVVILRLQGGRVASPGDEEAAVVTPPAHKVGSTPLM